MTRDPRTDPSPGDILRDPLEDFPRVVIKCYGSRVLLEIGRHNRTWMRVDRWREWAAQGRVVMALVATNQEG
jgi:hypothetical protein